jgi:hypothetical protein
MALVRGNEYMLGPDKEPRKKHKVTPIAGEFGRYFVDSHSLAKRGKEGAYIVDVLAVEETNFGNVTGTCACKGWSVRKTCSHLEDALEEHRKLVAEKADDVGFSDLDNPLLN